MAKRIYDSKGFKPEQLSEPEFFAIIHDTYKVLTSKLHNITDKKQLADFDIKHEIPPELIAALEQNAFMFSGFKIFHQANEISSLLKGEDGGFKPYSKFAQDVKAIDSKYNKNYLRAEYNFATQSTLSAVKWQDIEQDGDKYNLQYRTAGDGRVREEHAILNGTTLPPSDPFWDKYYPPNGWNCRCTAVQVRKGKYPESDSKTAIANGDRATTKIGKAGVNKAAIFRFNTGKEMKLMPPKHPYLPKGCGNCPFGGSETLADRKKDCTACGKRKKAMGDVPKNDDITAKLKRLHTLKGAEYNKELKEICGLKTFKPVPDMKNVFWTGNESDLDMGNLKTGAAKAVAFGNKVYIMPNPKTTRTADFIFENKGIYKDYDLKSITGKNSVGNRMQESIGQTRRVLLNMNTEYNPRNLAKEIKSYFGANKDAVEVLIYKGKRQIKVSRYDIDKKHYDSWFYKTYNQKK